MRKSLKGAVALGAASLLLTGGYGSLALWSDSETMNGGNINSGELSFAGSTAGVWKDVTGGGAGTAISDISTFKVVPGDTLTYSLTRTVNASGKHLSATLSADPASVTGDAALRNDMNITTSIKVNGATTSAITSANNGDPVAVTVTFAFARSSGNASQTSSLDLSALELNLNQN